MEEEGEENGRNGPADLASLTTIKIWCVGVFAGDIDLRHRCENI